MAGQHSAVGRMALTALAYLLAALAGQLLALAPGYSSPVWPAAGLALAALLKWGPHNWPGVFVGAFLFNVGLNVTPSGAAIAALIALGSTLQALIGARVSRHLYIGAEIDTRSRSLLLSVLLRGPLVCIVASTIGIATLYGFGVVPIESTAHQWLAWTAGDVLGVLLFTPLFIWIWPGPVDGGCRRTRRVALPLLITAVLLVLGHIGVDRLEEQRADAERESLIGEIDAVARIPMRDSVEAMHSVERWFAVSGDVTRADFATFTRRIAARPEILAIEWAPRVAGADRAAFERRLGVEIPTAQHIVYLDADLRATPAPTLPEYFPVAYSEPAALNRVAIGLDYRFEASRAAAMTAARDGASPAASTAVRIRRGDGMGHLVFLPVYREGFEPQAVSVQARQRALRGYIVGLYDTDRLLAPLVRFADGHRLALRVTDVTLADSPQRVFGSSRSVGGPQANRTIQFADRIWRIEIESLAGARLDGAGPYARAYTAISVLLALLVCFTFIGIAGHAERLRGDLKLREQLQAAQEASELYLATTLHSIGEAVIAADVQGRVTRINRAAEQLTGFSLAATPRAALAEVFVAVDEVSREPIVLDVPQLMMNGAGRDLGERALLVAHDGSEQPIVGNFAPIVGTDGKAQGAVLVFRGVGQERAMLADLTESEARFRALTSLSSDWFWEQDEEFRFVPMPQGTRHADGIERDSHVGKTRWELPGTEVMNTDWESHRALLQARQPFRDLLLRRMLPQGERYVLISGAPRFTPDGIFVGYRGVARNVTKEKQAGLALIHARDAAEAASSAKSAFLANMSHEIRTPMNGVIGMLEVLATTPLSVDQEDAVSTIRGSAFSLLGLIDDILDFSKIEAGHMELERVPVELASIVEGVCQTLVSMAIGKNVLLSVFVDPRIPAAIWSDSTRLRQALNNLVGNAIKFSGGRPEHKGRVSVRIERVSSEPLRLSMAVIDNGIGMSPQAVAGLFTSFSQAEASTTRRFGGTGLGLAICRRLVELMHGTIGVQSTPGSGSVFTIELPAEAVEGHAQPELDDLSGLDCIVVDTEELRTDDLRTYLEHVGARVHRAGDLDQAARLAAGLEAAVIVRDVGGSGQAARETPGVSPGLREVLLRRGRRTRARTEGSAFVTVDADAMSHAAFVGSVAMAAGRRPPVTYRPAAADAQAAQLPSAPTVAEAREAGTLILVAEDDSINQKVILRQLALLGLAAEVANDGLEALGLWRQGGYALLLSDLHMPNMDGYTLAQSIHDEEREGSRLPILALTANALKGEASRARAAGMDDYLTKPIQLKVLKAALETWMNTSKPSTPAPPVVTAVAPDVASAAPVAVDLSVLTGLVGDDPGVVDEFLRDYLASVRSLAPGLDAARHAGDLPKIATIAHKLKSSSRSIGAMVLGDLCAELEQAGRAGVRDAVDRFAQDFEAERVRVEACLQEALSCE